jgi:hypothetical protein
MTRPRHEVVTNMTEALSIAYVAAISRSEVLSMSSLACEHEMHIRVSSCKENLAA